MQEKRHVTFTPVESAAQITTLVELARGIWTEHYVPIIGQAQMDYMLEHFQSEGAIARQIEEGYEYFLATLKAPGVACLPPQACVPTAAGSVVGGKVVSPEHDCNPCEMGYLALVPDAAAGELMISKLYVSKAVRGGGVGKAMLRFAEQRAREGHYKKLWLTVNKHNSNSVAWYERMGFENAGSIVMNIGEGFVMDDFRMEKRLEF